MRNIVYVILVVGAVTGAVVTVALSNSVEVIIKSAPVVPASGHSTAP